MCKLKLAEEMIAAGVKLGLLAALAAGGFPLALRPVPSSRQEPRGDAEHFAKVIGRVADTAADLARLILADTGQMSYYSNAGGLGCGFEAGAAGGLVIVVNWRGLLRLRTL
jgi:hypothetical protein